VGRGSSLKKKAKYGVGQGSTLQSERTARDGLLRTADRYAYVVEALLIAIYLPEGKRTFICTFDLPCHLTTWDLPS
jgi:hypothetical protein